MDTGNGSVLNIGGGVIEEKGIYAKSQLRHRIRIWFDVIQTTLCERGETRLCNIALYRHSSEHHRVRRERGGGRCPRGPMGESLFSITTPDSSRRATRASDKADGGGRTMDGRYRLWAAPINNGGGPRNTPLWRAQQPYERPRVVINEAPVALLRGIAGKVRGK